MQEGIITTPEVSFNMVDGVWCKQMHFKEKGCTMSGHTHTHNHLTLLAKGSLKVTVEGKVTVFTAPHMIFIHKDNAHELVALEDDTVAYCIHAVRDADTGDIIDQVIIPDGINLETL
jgi:quercetin dioxygenase-like cupin family protein